MMIKVINMKTSKETPIAKKAKLKMKMKKSEVEPNLNEYIFLIDRSGSMSGQKIKLAAEALRLFVHSLPVGSKLNIISYGS